MIKLPQQEMETPALIAYLKTQGQSYCTLCRAGNSGGVCAGFNLRGERNE